MRRSFPAVLAAGLAVLLATSLVPAASAQQPASGARPAAGGWSAADVIEDVDWAEFAREHRAEYEASSWAALRDDGAAERAREELHRLYRSDDGSAAYQAITPARTGATAAQYYDECDDGTNLPPDGRQAGANLFVRADGPFPSPSVGGISYNPDDTAPPPQIDLRSTFLVQSQDDQGRLDQTGFLVYACEEWANSALGAGGITFGLHVAYEEGEFAYPTLLGDQPEEGPDFIVSIFPEPAVPSRPLQIMAVRTPTRDRSTWTLTFLDTAQRLDGFEVDGIVPTSAIGDFPAETGFAWTVEVVDTQLPRGGRDWFPERNMVLEAEDPEADPEAGDPATFVGLHAPQFPVPENCGTQREGIYPLTPQRVTPNDPGFPSAWYHQAIRTPDAWMTIADSGTGGRSRPVTVAVVDTGIDGPRFDFINPVSRVTAGLDAAYGFELEGVDNDGAIGPFDGARRVPYEDMSVAVPRNSDRDPHGTAVAGLIGGRGNNGQEIAGVDWGVRLMPIRVQDVNNCITNVAAAAGIKWAVDHGADIVHISLSSPASLVVPEVESGLNDDVPNCSDGVDNDNDGDIDFPEDPDCDDEDDDTEAPEAGERDPLREVIDYALEQGVPVVAAAGNFGATNEVIYPAAYPGVMSVGAVTRAAEVPEYSSSGRWLDLVAPGGVGTGSPADDLLVLWELNRLRAVAGTSFAAPLVSGAMALYLGLNPHITRGFTPPATQPSPDANLPDDGYQRTVDDLRVALQNASRDLGIPGHDRSSGWGLLDVDRLLDVPALGGPLVDPARVQLPRTNADTVVEITEDIALSREDEADVPCAHPPGDSPDQPCPFVVFTRSDVYVDALAGAPLTAGGPLLVAGAEGIAESTWAVLQQILPPGGRTYVLGGEEAVSPAVAAALAERGYEVVRLGGPSRTHTALAVAEEVRRLWPGTSRVALARADGGGDATAGWADAVTGGAWAARTGTPLLVTASDGLHPDVAAALDAWGTTQTVLLGGTAALSQAVEDAVPGPQRVSGADRAATATAVADVLWEDPADGFLLANGYYARGWAAALAAAGWAADSGRPLLLTAGSSVPQSTAALLADVCAAPETLRLVGGASLITGSVETTLLEATSC